MAFYSESYSKQYNKRDIRMLLKCSLLQRRSFSLLILVSSPSNLPDRLGDTSISQAFQPGNFSVCIDWNNRISSRVAQLIRSHNLIFWDSEVRGYSIDTRRVQFIWQLFCNFIPLIGIIREVILSSWKQIHSLNISGY